jgi:hypothetical protein
LWREGSGGIKRPRVDDGALGGGGFDVYDSDPACAKLVSDFGSSFCGDGLEQGDGGGGAGEQEAEVGPFSGMQAGGPAFLASARAVFPP